MPTHKVVNQFIRDYNKEFSIKGYSKMGLEEKMNAVKKMMDKISDKTARNKIRQDYRERIQEPFNQKAKAGSLKGALGKKFNKPETKKKETKKEVKLGKPGLLDKKPLGSRNTKPASKLDPDSARNLKEAMRSLRTSDLKDILEDGKYPTNRAPIHSEIKKYMRELIKQRESK